MVLSAREAQLSWWVTGLELDQIHTTSAFVLSSEHLRPPWRWDSLQESTWGESRRFGVIRIFWKESPSTTPASCIHKIPSRTWASGFANFFSKWNHTQSLTHKTEGLGPVPVSYCCITSWWGCCFDWLAATSQVWGLVQMGRPPQPFSVNLRRPFPITDVLTQLFGILLSYTLPRGLYLLKLLIRGEAGNLGNIPWQ